MGEAVANEDLELSVELAQLKADFVEYKAQTEAKISELEKKIADLEFELPKQIQNDMIRSTLRGANL